MSLKQSQLILLTTTSLFMLTSQSSLAFSVNGPRTTSTLLYTRASDSSDGIVATYNILELLPPSDNSDFILMLKNQFPGWNFDNKLTNILTGSFDIQTYSPCLGITGSTGCAVSANTPPDVAGAFLNLKYTAGMGDPSLALGKKIHWIQRIFNNYDPNTGYGKNENKIDTQLPNNPYYDSSYPFFNDPSLTPDVFRDTSTRRISPIPSPSEIRWQAELYLVEETATRIVNNKVVGDVKIYNGIGWGWTNILTPPISLPPLPCTGGSGGGGCLTVASANRIASRELPLSDFDSGDPNQSSERVPEPTTILGLLALGAAGTIQMLKNKFTKQQ